MTVKQFYDHLLTELNKVQAPSLLLEDYVYFFNKAIGQYTNKIYNLYEINQQKSDDLRVLKSTAILTPIVSTAYSAADLLSKTYQVDLPDDYLHILNCVVEYVVVPLTYKCFEQNDVVHMGAKRMTADMFPQLIQNYYMKPKYNNPYYYINNVAADTLYPITEVPPIINTQVTQPDTSLVERVADYRYGNKSKVRMEIRYGNDNSIFRLNKVYVDYLRSPQYIKLTQTQIDSVTDTSQLLEFPDYVCQEILNELIKLIMENASDPRLQTNIPVNQTIPMGGK